MHGPRGGAGVGERKMGTGPGCEEAPREGARGLVDPEGVQVTSFFFLAPEAQTQLCSAPPGSPRPIFSGRPTQGVVVLVG